MRESEPSLPSTILGATVLLVALVALGVATCNESPPPPPAVMLSEVPAVPPTPPCTCEKPTDYGDEIEALRANVDLISAIVLKLTRIAESGQRLDTDLVDTVRLLTDRVLKLEHQDDWMNPSLPLHTYAWDPNKNVVWERDGNDRMTRGHWELDATGAYTWRRD